MFHQVLLRNDLINKHKETYKQWPELKYDLKKIFKSYYDNSCKKDNLQVKEFMEADMDKWINEYNKFDWII